MTPQKRGQSSQSVDGELTPKQKRLKQMQDALVQGESSAASTSSPSAKQHRLEQMQSVLPSQVTSKPDVFDDGYENESMLSTPPRSQDAYRRSNAPSFETPTRARTSRDLDDGNGLFTPPGTTHHIGSRLSTDDRREIFSQGTELVRTFAAT